MLKSKISSFVETNHKITESYEKGDMDGMIEAIESASLMLEQKNLKKYLRDFLSSYGTQYLTLAIFAGQ